MKPVHLFLCLILLTHHQAGTAGKQTTNPTPITISGLPAAAEAKAGLPSQTLININRISAWYSSDAVQEMNQSIGGAGLIYPRGTATAVYSSGLLWGGKFHDGLETVLRVNGTVYNTGMKPGAILGIRTGISEDPSGPNVRIWRIRRDFATADLRQDAAEVNNVSVDEVTAGMIATVRAQYETDWTEWPWDRGAPFYDGNNNGIRESGEDPGLAGADQVVWFVCNDLDVSQPWTNVESGIELQVTVWGYNQSGPLGDAIFKRSRFIYKGTTGTSASAVIDSMYVCHFVDVDLGSFADDFSGCDTVINLGYVYNGSPNDADYAEYGLIPPSLGYRLAQGPIEFTGNSLDTAMFDFRKIPGARKVPVTAFLYHAAGGIYSTPPFNSDGGIQWHRIMRGLPPTPQGPPDPLPPFDPYTGERAGPFWLYAGSDGISAPNPANPNGWVDGMLEGPGDRHLMQSTGPFQLALDDTQDVVYAMVGGLGDDYLQSVVAMKANSSAAQAIYNDLVNEPAPIFSVLTTLTAGPAATLRIEGDATASTPAGISFVLKRQDGSVVVADILYDDGTHGDGTAGDFIFTNTIAVSREAGPMHLDGTVSYGLGQEFTWEHVYDGITTVGLTSVDDLRIFSDNFNDDGEANPGENVRYGFTLSYSGIAALADVVLTADPETDGKSLAYPLVPDGFMDTLVYNPDDEYSYLSVDIPADFSGSNYSIAVSILDSLENIWRETLLVPIIPLATPVRNAEITHTQGTALGQFEILVLDSVAVTNHTYKIEGLNEPDGFLGFTLRDSTDGRVLLDHHAFPDEFGHNIPVTDGFKIMRGSIEPFGGWDTSIVTGNPVWNSILANGLDLEGFGGAMGSGWLHWFSGSTLPSSRASDVLIKFASTDLQGNPVNAADTLVSFAYRYLQNADLPPARPEFAQYIIHPDPGFPFQSFEKSVPFAAYDINSIPPRHLAVGHLENNVMAGLVDGKYWPGTAGNTFDISPREWFFIFDLDYAETSDPALEADILNETLPLLWWGTPRRNGNIAFQAGDQFQIVAYYPYHSSDVWTFNPTILVGVPDEGIPLDYALWQNYPNPFNPTTAISYSVPQSGTRSRPDRSRDGQLSAVGHVSLRVYNVLGQEVKTLVDGIENPGKKIVEWNATNNRGVRVSSGVYFYRLSTTNFVQTKKLVLLR